MNGHGSLAADFPVKELTPNDFSKEDLLMVFGNMYRSRRLDAKMLTLLKQGKGFFHIGSSGHEAAQAAAGYFSRPGHDWFCTYYRDLCTCLMLGVTSRETMLAHLAKADDPSSAGRQMSEHFGYRDKNVMTTSSSVGAQFLPAVGFALSLQREDSDAYVYCSCGDGATSQGDFHEALNWSARVGAPVLFFVQDNKYAISVPSTDQTAGGSAYALARGYDGLARARVDGTDFFQVASVYKAAVERIRDGRGPVCIVADVVRLLPHSSSDDHGKYRDKDELEAEKQSCPIQKLENAILESGLAEQTELDDIKSTIDVEIDEAAVWADGQPDPDPATAEKHVYYEGPDERVYHKGDANGDPVVLVDAINHALSEEMERDEKIIVYGEDVGGNKGGVFTATRGLTKKFGPDRCFNAPLAEASIVGTAVGFAAFGYKPVIEIQFADYIWPALQQIRNQVASFRYRSNSQWDCPMVIRVPTGGYIHGGLCHSQNIEAFFAHMPGLHVVMPSNAADAKGLLKSAIRGNDPVLFLEHKALYRAAAARAPETDSDYLVPLGEARVVREGTHLTVVTYGMMVHKSVNAARILEKEGVNVEVIDLRSINPLDSKTILDSVRKTNRAIVIHEDHEFGGFGGELVAQITGSVFEHLDAPVRRFAGAFTPIPFADPLERAVLPQDDGVIDAIRSLAQY